MATEWGLKWPMNRLRCGSPQMQDGTFAAADALQKLRIVQVGFKSAAEAEIRLRKLEQ